MQIMHAMLVFQQWIFHAQFNLTVQDSNLESCEECKNSEPLLGGSSMERMHARTHAYIYIHTHTHTHKFAPVFIAIRSSWVISHVIAHWHGRLLKSASLHWVSVKVSNFKLCLTYLLSFNKQMLPFDIMEPMTVTNKSQYDCRQL
jgi:hypothetical protein